MIRSRKRTSLQSRVSRGLRGERSLRSPGGCSISLANSFAVSPSLCGRPTPSGATRTATTRNPAPLDPNFVGCVSIRSDNEGIYRIRTIKPGAYPAGPNSMRPPHIHFEVHGRFERLITQMYFPDEPLNACDRLLNAALRPDLLIAKPVPSKDGSGLRVLNFDIVLARG